MSMSSTTMVCIFIELKLDNCMLFFKRGKNKVHRERAVNTSLYMRSKDKEKLNILLYSPAIYNSITATICKSIFHI